MDTHKIKSLLPEIRSRMLMAHTKRKNQEYLSLKPMHQYTRSLNDNEVISKAPALSSSQTQTFPRRAGFLAKLSLLQNQKQRSNAANNDREDTHGLSKLHHVQTGMLSGKIFRLPAIGASQASFCKRGGHDFGRSSGNLLARLPAYDTMTASQGTYARHASLSESDDVNSTLSIEPYPFQSLHSPYENIHRDIESPEAMQEKQREPKKRRKRQKEPKDPSVRIRQPGSKHNNHQRGITHLRSNVPNMCEEQLASQLPVKKLFNYSRTIDSELREYIRPRLPGGKLKPVFKRTQDGEMFIPAHPLTVKDHHLLNITSLGVSRDDEVHPDMQLMRRHGEDLETFLERKRKMQLMEELRKKPMTVSFEGFSARRIRRSDPHRYALFRRQIINDGVNENDCRRYSEGYTPSPHTPDTSRSVSGDYNATRPTDQGGHITVCVTNRNVHGNNFRNNDGIYASTNNANAHENTDVMHSSNDEYNGYGTKDGGHVFDNIAERYDGDEYSYGSDDSSSACIVRYAFDESSDSEYTD